MNLAIKAMLTLIVTCIVACVTACIGCGRNTRSPSEEIHRRTGLVLPQEAIVEKCALDTVGDADSVLAVVSIPAKLFVGFCKDNSIDRERLLKSTGDNMAAARAMRLNNTWNTPSSCTNVASQWIPKQKEDARSTLLSVCFDDQETVQIWISSVRGL